MSTSRIGLATLGLTGFPTQPASRFSLPHPPEITRFHILAAAHVDPSPLPSVHPDTLLEPCGPQGSSARPLSKSQSCPFAHDCTLLIAKGMAAGPSQAGATPTCPWRWGSCEVKEGPPSPAPLPRADVGNWSPITKSSSAASASSTQCSVRGVCELVPVCHSGLGPRQTMTLVFV